MGHGSIILTCKISHVVMFLIQKLLANYSNFNLDTSIFLKKIVKVCRNYE